MSEGPKKPARRPLIAAAQASAVAPPPAAASTAVLPPNFSVVPTQGAPSATPAPKAVRPAPSTSAQIAADMSSVDTSSTIGGSSAGSTPVPLQRPGVGGSQLSDPPVPKAKYKPRVVRRPTKQEPDLKPDPVALAAAAPPAADRGALRGRGRGMAPRGRGAPVASTSIAAGIFGGGRNPISSSGGRRGGGFAPPRFTEDQSVDLYSDNEEDERSGGQPKVIDIGAISGLSESAPTSLFRDRTLNQGGKAKGVGKAGAAGKGKERGKSKAGEGGGMEIEQTRDMTDFETVKTEPLSPIKRAPVLPGQRMDDVMMRDDETQDRDEQGRRLADPDKADPVVNEAQKVDLSESESEEEEESMEGDFVPAPGYDPPQDKLFVFQFPHLFPDFAPAGPVDLTNEKDSKEGIKDVKPAIAGQKGKKKDATAPPPEGRIGTMVVMKSGKVKMVMGRDIVMNVTPGVSSTFIQQLVHLDAPTHSTNVLGEVHKQYVVTPDIDRLLEELYLAGGTTPGDKLAEIMKVKPEPGLMKMEDA